MVREVDKGFKRIQRELALMKGSHTKVGVQSGTSRRPAAKQKTTDMVTVALANEFGTQHIPERSFMRTTYDEKRGTVARLMESEATKIVAGKSTVRRSLGLVGEYFQGQIQKKISSNVPPPNAPSTVRRKGSSTTLIDSGQLRGSIRHVEKVRGI